MADHLREQTLPTDKAELARYYQRGMVAEFAGGLEHDTFATEAESLLRLGATLEEMPEALAATVTRRHAAFVDAYLAGELPDVDEATALARLAEFVVVSDDPAAEGEDVLVRLRRQAEDAIADVHWKQRQAESWEPPSNPADAEEWGRDLARFREEWTQELARLETEDDRIVRAFQDAETSASYRFEKVLEAAGEGLHGHTAAAPRRDMHPRLVELLALDPNRSPSRDEIANLLNGQRADGEDIPGKQRQRATVSLADALGLDPKRAPTWDEVSHILDGRRADGKAVEGAGTDTARGRFLALLGTKAKELEPVQERNLLAGRMADGSDIDSKAYEAGVTASKARIGYVDLTFSADKSLSVAWAFAPTEAERNIIAQAHKDAVDSAMEYVAAEMGQVRRGKGGKDGTEPGHIGWLMFDHCTSRSTVEIARTDEHGQAYTELLTLRAAGDPQLHTHAAVPNVVLTDTGRVGAMDLDKLEGRVHEFGAYYQAHVATNLRRHGVEVVLDERTGAARLTAIPEHVRDAFSKRTRNGTEAAREYAADLGLDWDALSPERKAGLVKEGTQTHKLAKAAGMSAEDRAAFEGAARKDDMGDFAAWQRQAEALHWTHRSVLRPDEIAPERTRDERLEHAYQVALPLLDKELQRRAKVDGQDLRVVAARSLVASGVESAQDIGAITRAFATRGVRQDGRDTSLIWGEDVPVRGKARVGVTTALHEDQERELVRLAKAAAGDRSAALSPAAIARAVSGREAMPLEKGGLRFAGAHGEAQREIMDRLGQGGRFAVAIGVAGAGKSALLAPLVDAWREDGRQIYGAALAWQHTENLAGAGIEAKNRAAFAAFLKRAQAGTIQLDRNSIVVVDELGLVGTRQLLDMLRLQERHGFQLVAVGDPKQCQSIEAGPVIGILQNALGEGAIPELLTTMRQRTQEERDTSLMFREGRAAEALEVKRRNGTAQIVPGGYREAVEHVAALWKARVEANAHDPGFTLTVSAPTNSDARALGTAIRERRRQMGQLGPDQVKVDAQDQAGARFELALAAGDRVRLFDRARASFGDGKAGNIGSNGSVLEVRGTDAEGVTLRNIHGSEGKVRWETLRDQTSGRIRLTYGDVLSIDATQSATSTEHINAMPGGTKPVNGFKGYVAESRHRQATWLVVSDGAERQEVAGRRPLGDPRPVREADVWANMARNLSRQPEKASALAFLDRAKEVRRGTVRSLQAGLQPAEQRRHEGREGTTLHQTFEQRRRMEGAARAAERMDRAAARRPRALDKLAAIRPAVRAAVAQGMEKVRPALERAVQVAQKIQRTHQAGHDERQAPRQARRPRPRM
jgi:hypothetical protein